MHRRALWLIAAFTIVATQAHGDQHSNPPWAPSLMAFEHYDSGRTHLFERARFGGSFGGCNSVDVRAADASYPSGYNMVYRNPSEIFIYGGGYGNVPNSIGPYVAKVDPNTLEPIWYTQLLVTAEVHEWNYPGVVALMNDDFLYVIYGYRLARIDPADGSFEVMELPYDTTVGAANTSYNGFDALSDGTLVAKTVFRNPNCDMLQGPDGLFKCPCAAEVPPSMLVSIDPCKLQVLDQVTLPQPVGGRPTTARFQGKDFVYLATPTTAIRYEVQDGMFTLDTSWNPGNIYYSGQTVGSAVAIMNNWFVVQSNGNPAMAPLSVIAIHQGNASQMHRLQPFSGLPVVQPTTPGFPATVVSWAPMSVSVDPDHNVIYTADSYPSAIAAVKLTASGLHTLWTAQQRTTEFLAIIGPRGRRVLVTTDFPGQPPYYNTTDEVVWRNAQTGEELARTAEALPAMTAGTMIQPYYFRKIFYMGQEGELFSLKARPTSCAGDLDQDGSVGGADLAVMFSLWGGPSDADLNDDAHTDGADLTMLLSAWGPCGTN